MNEEQKFIDFYQKYGIVSDDYASILALPWIQESLTGARPKKVSKWFDLEVKGGEGLEGGGDGSEWCGDLKRDVDIIEMFHFKGNDTIKLMSNTLTINEWIVDGELIVSPFKYGQGLPVAALPYSWTKLVSENEFSVRYYGTILVDQEDRKEVMLAWHGKGHREAGGLNEKGEYVFIDGGSLSTAPNRFGINLKELETGAPNVPMEQRTGEK